ncbi:hypothetical protein [Hymenobacter artigasi]|uniref:Uncharacterized protein n=1 Tax=Hymenobacter artigasi TaxID=2719616 RepID=A0ABX1HPU9_9BACT|nr:hypothetical protein [Hymenobacter artigasi]NKI91091.1 hypothetical protein [Hymenobacter artigasi]
MTVKYKPEGKRNASFQRPLVGLLASGYRCKARHNQQLSTAELPLKISQRRGAALLRHWQYNRLVK